MVVFGATGGTGTILLSQLLERFPGREHSVTAFVRNPDKVAAKGANLSVVRGDVLDYDAVTSAITGQDVVLVCLGASSPRDTSELRANGTANIINAMEAAGVRRIVCLSAFGVGDSRRDLPLFFKYFIVPLVLKRVYADHERQEELLRRSGLDWTIVRPAVLIDAPLTNSYWHGLHRDGTSLSAKIGRADVADFMINQMTVDTYVHSAPLLSYRR